MRFAYRHTEKRDKHMKTQHNNYQAGKSTYAMVVQFEQEERRAYEGAVYMLFMIAAVFSIWHVAHQPVMLPTTLATQRPPLVQVVGEHQQGV